MVAAVSLLQAAPASAQDPDPYGNTTTTQGGQTEVTIELTVDSGPRGTEVGVFACGYADDAPEGSITFDGDVVATGLAVDAEGCLTSGERGSSQGPGAPVSFVVPEEARPGNRNVCAVVAGYETPCARFQVRQDAEVAGVTEENERDTSLPVVGTAPFTGSLPRTGLAVGMLLAIAVVLLVAGRRFLAESRRRRGDVY